VWYVCIHTLYTHTHTHIHARTRAHTHTYAYLKTPLCIIRVCMYIHTYVYTYIHVHCECVNVYSHNNTTHTQHTHIRLLPVGQAFSKVWYVCIHTLYTHTHTHIHTLTFTRHFGCSSTIFRFQKMAKSVLPRITVMAVVWGLARPGDCFRALPPGISLAGTSSHISYSARTFHASWRKLPAAMLAVQPPSAQLQEVRRLVIKRISTASAGAGLLVICGAECAAEDADVASGSIVVKAGVSPPATGAVYVTARLAGAMKGLSKNRDLSPVASIRIPVDNSTRTPINFALSGDNITPEGREDNGAWWAGQVCVLVQ
jgi:hypothetical protein